MAIKKEVTLSNGIVATYHRIESVVADYLKNQTSIKMVSYVKEGIRDEEKKRERLEVDAQEVHNSIHEAQANEDVVLANALTEKYTAMITELGKIELIGYKLKTETIVVEGVPATISIDSAYTLLEQAETNYKGGKEI